MRKQNGSFSGKLVAYSLAAGAGAMMASATPAQAAIQHFDNGGAGWYDASDWNPQDLVMFKMDGTVVLNTANTGLQSLGQDADSFTFQFIGPYSTTPFMWYGTDPKEGIMLNIGANVGYVGGGYVWNPERGQSYSPWDVGRLGANYVVGPDTLADDRVWSDHAATSTGGIGGWYFYFRGEWPFGGGGYIGLYADAEDGRHYGWARINAGGYNSVMLYEFAFETNPGDPILTGDTGPEVPPGSFDGDMDVDTVDIDLLCDFIRNGMAYDALYDISGDGVTGVPDGVVNMLDLDYLIRFLVETSIGNGTEYGDFNLDGKIDTTDLTRLATYYGAGDTWAKGNANRYIDLVSDTTDLTILATYYGFGEPDAVPEPMTLSILALGASGLLKIRRRE